MAFTVEVSERTAACNPGGEVVIILDVSRPHVWVSLHTYMILNVPFPH